MSRLLHLQLDAPLLRLAAAGDAAAQRAVYEALAGPVFALVRRVVGGRAAAEDVFQDSMLAVLRHLDGYRGEAPFGAWVRQVALRQCLMHLRSPWQRLRTVLADIELPAPPAADAERIDLERALARLPEVARVIVWLHDVEGLTHEEIAALYGRTPSFSKSQLSRAHALLRGLLEPSMAEPVPPATAIAAQGQVP